MSNPNSHKSSGREMYQEGQAKQPYPVKELVKLRYTVTRGLLISMIFVSSFAVTIFLLDKRNEDIHLNLFPSTLID